MKRLYSSINQLTEWLGSLMLGAMVVIVFMTVITRYVFAYTPRWSEEVSLLLMVWFGFLGLALGVAGKVHLSMNVLTEWLPRAPKRVLDMFALLTVLAIGVFMAWEGWKLVQVAHGSTMAGTGLPSSALYLVVPLSGLLIILHSILQLFGFDTTQRNPDKE